MAKFGLLGKLAAQPGRRKDLVEVLLEAAAVLGELPECESYVVNVSQDEPDVVWVVEVWADQEAHQASLQDDRVRPIVQRGRPLVAAVGQQIRMTQVGGKGCS